MERLSHPFSLHDANADTGTFKGLASAFNTLIDAFVPTRILPGAFAKTLQENKHRIKVLWNHDSYTPIGVPTKMAETDRGLFVEAKISPTTSGKDCLILLRDKVVTEMSIGFDPVRVEMVEETIDGLRVMVRHISELRLWEFSPVTWGANRDALVTQVHRRSGPDITSQLAELAHTNRRLALIDVQIDQMLRCAVRDLERQAREFRR